MIIFAEEMNSDQLREAALSLIPGGDHGDKTTGHISNKSYYLFINRFPGHLVNCQIERDNSTTRTYYGTIELSNASVLIWKSSIGDPNSYLAYIRAQLHWLMPEGFDFPD